MRKTERRELVRLLGVTKCAPLACIHQAYGRIVTGATMSTGVCYVLPCHDGSSRLVRAPRKMRLPTRGSKLPRPQAASATRL
jgi:hypothetical protein